jgi:hypothetical protein
MPLPAIGRCNASCRIINGSTIWRRSISQTRDITHIRQTACGREKGLRPLHLARLLGLDDVDPHLAEHGEGILDLLGKAFFLLAFALVS